MRLTLADARCKFYFVLYRIASRIGFPGGERIYYGVYVRAVRRANDIYWAEWAAAHGDTNYAERRR